MQSDDIYSLQGGSYQTRRSKGKNGNIMACPFLEFGFIKGIV